MAHSVELPCEACGQLASPEHIARRLRRLERTTRYRPLHIQTLFVSAVAPADDASFLYSPDGRFQGEAGELLDALEISREGKSAEGVLTEFQKRGLLFVHVLECPLEPDQRETLPQQFLDRHLPATLARIRRSLKPKRILLFSAELAPLQNRFTESQLGVPVFSNHGHPFQLPLIGSPRDEFLRALASPIST
jgi:hypothetical protein